MKKESKFSKTKILVTGGTGYIGSHTVVELQQKGFEVCILDNLSNSTIEVISRIESITGIRPSFEKLDLVNGLAINSFLNQHIDIKAVVHFAASKAVGESVANPLYYYENNVVSMINLIKACIDNKISSLVFSSSCTVYGQPDLLPVTEEAPFKMAESPYGYTKQVGEQLLQDVCNSLPFNAISLRYFNPIGAHPSGLIGELPTGIPNNLVPYITQCAIGLRDTLSIFGDDYPTSDGTCIRDYINVVDLAKAHVAAIEKALSNQSFGNFDCFNIGTGKGTSVLELVQTFEKVNKLKLNYKIVGRRAGDITQVWADTSKANNELGWKSIQSLSDTLQSAWNWEKNLQSSYVKK